MDNKKTNTSPLAGQLTAATKTTDPATEEFSWGELPKTGGGSSSSFDYGFDRFPAPRKDANGKEQFANKSYDKTHKAVANALAKYLADLTEKATTDEEKANLPEFRKSVIKGSDGKPTGTRVFRIK